MRIIKLFVLFLVIIHSNFVANGQVLKIDTAQVYNQIVPALDSLGILDSLANHPEYESVIADSIQSFFKSPEKTPPLDSTILSNTEPIPKSDIETTIDYKASDSIFFILLVRKCIYMEMER